MASTSQQAHLFEDYDGFVEKFKPKKTTDDCYTPPEVYDVILDWVVERYGIDREAVVRPFWPGGDYERFDYPDGCVVVDNPPFSMISAIERFYIAHGIRFFLFAPALSMLGGPTMRVCHVAVGCSITYANGAEVNTGFATNLDAEAVLEAAPDLGDAIREVCKRLAKATKKQVTKQVLPDNVMTAAKANWFAMHHTPYRLAARDCAFIRTIDAMGGRNIFGGGLLLNDRAAAERAAAERAAAERVAAERAAAERAAAERVAAERYELSPREWEMVRMLSEGRNHGEAD